jgi:DNA-binding SARP family transcriptional activator
VRHYALEHFAGAAERERVEQRFAGHYLGVLEAAAPNLVGGSNDPRLLARLVADHDNLRAAAVWAIADREGAELALRFVGVLFWFLYALGLFREAREITDRALALATGSEPALLRGRALASSACTALAQGDYARARADFEAALPLLREAGDTPGTAAALAMYGAAWLQGGDVAGAVPILDEALALTAGWPDHDIAVIFARYWRGWAAYSQGQIDLADSLFAPCRRAGREHRLPTTYAHTTAMLGRVAFARGHSEEACQLLAEALECELALGDGWGIAQALDVAALVAARRGRYEEAALLVAGIEAHRTRLAMALSGPAPAERGRLLEQLREALGSAFDVVYARGAALSTAEIVECGFAEASRETAEHPVVQPLQPASQTDGAAPRLRVLALGPLQVFVGERLIAAAAWGSARPRELLLYLLLHPEGRTKEQVGLAFWPDASPAQLRNSFHVTLHRLRRALGGADWVTLVNDRYRIPPDLIEEFDVRAFEQNVTAARFALKRQEADAVTRLEQALARFGGDLLDGEPVGDWHLEHRDQLQRLYVDALMDLGARHTREERHERAAEAFRRVLAHDCVHEQALQELMRCHVAMGERPQALRLYRQFADRLRAELETEPGVDTVRLFERLQQGAGA